MFANFLKHSLLGNLLIWERKGDFKSFMKIKQVSISKSEDNQTPNASSKARTVVGYRTNKLKVTFDMPIITVLGLVKFIRTADKGNRLVKKYV